MQIFNWANIESWVLVSALFALVGCMALVRGRNISLRADRNGLSITTDCPVARRRKRKAPDCPVPKKAA